MKAILTLTLPGDCRPALHLLVEDLLRKLKPLAGVLSMRLTFDEEHDT